MTEVKSLEEQIEELKREKSALEDEILDLEGKLDQATRQATAADIAWDEGKGLMAEAREIIQDYERLVDELDLEGNAELEASRLRRAFTHWEGKAR